MKKIVKLITLVVVLGFCFVLPTNNFASAATTNPLYSSKDIQTIKNNLINSGVTEQTANKLITKLQSGTPLDSMVMLPSDPRVVVKKEVSETKVKTTYTFPDGSIAVATVEDAPTTNSKSISPRSISGGSCSGGSGYTNCNNRLVSFSTSVYGYSFHANYTYVQGGYDQITWAGNWNIWCAGGSYTNASMRIIKANEDANGRAEARLSATLVTSGSYGTITRSLSLLVGNDYATDSWNAYY